MAPERLPPIPLPISFSLQSKNWLIAYQLSSAFGTNSSRRDACSTAEVAARRTAILAVVFDGHPCPSRRWEMTPRQDACGNGTGRDACSTAEVAARRTAILAVTGVWPFSCQAGA